MRNPTSHRCRRIHLHTQCPSRIHLETLQDVPYMEMDRISGVHEDQLKFEDIYYTVDSLMSAISHIPANPDNSKLADFPGVTLIL